MKEAQEYTHRHDNLLPPYDPTVSAEREHRHREADEREKRAPFGDRFIQDTIRMIQLSSHPALPGQETTKWLNTLVQHRFPLEQSPVVTVDADVPGLEQKLHKQSNELVALRDGDEGINQADVLIRKTHLASSILRLYRNPSDEDTIAALGRVLRAALLGAGEMGDKTHEFVGWANHIYWEASKTAEHVRNNQTTKLWSLEVALGMTRALKQLFRPLQDFSASQSGERKSMQNRMPEYNISFTAEGRASIEEILSAAVQAQQVQAHTHKVQAQITETLHQSA